MLKLELTIEEANIILEALGSMPFIKVHKLIGKIQSQAQQQLADTQSSAETEQ